MLFILNFCLEKGPVKGPQSLLIDFLKVCDFPRQFLNFLRQILDCCNQREYQVGSFHCKMPFFSRLLKYKILAHITILKILSNYANTRSVVSYVIECLNHIYPRTNRYRCTEHIYPRMNRYRYTEHIYPRMNRYKYIRPLRRKLASQNDYLSYRLEKVMW